MKIEDVCSRQVASCRREEPLARAAREMQTRHVGALVVVDSKDPQRPVGILTDRDVVSGQLTRGADLNCLTVGDVMTPDPMTLPLHFTIEEAIAAMNRRGVRRAPVLDGANRLIGIVTLDDLLPAIAQQLGHLASLMGSQARAEGRH